jgi:hypothetical protein
MSEMHSLRYFTVKRVGLISHPRLGNIVALISTNNAIPNKFLGRTTPEVMAPSASTILDANRV